VKFTDCLRTLSYWIVFSSLVVIAIVPALIFALLPKSWRYDTKLRYWLEYMVYRLLIRSWWVPVTYVGKHNIPKNTPLIFAANHQSALDIPLLGVLARAKPNLWLMWYALAKYPIFGYFMRRTQVIVDTRSPRRAVQAIDDATQLLAENGRHLMIFPEGSRFADGTVHKFFLGFALLAKKTHRPVVPVMIKNVEKVCMPKAITITYAPITVIIGEPFHYHEGESESHFLERVHAWFVSQQ
jgi:1-acyl-sn-glycerol-3-phosphate acyltransferase